MADNKAQNTSKTTAKPPTGKSTSGRPVSGGAPSAKVSGVTRSAKPGVPKGTKRGQFNKDGTPRRKPGPKPGSRPASLRTQSVIKGKAATPKPIVSKPIASKPVASKPVTSKATASKPAAKPVATQSVKAKASAPTVRKAGKANMPSPTKAKPAVAKSATARGPAKSTRTVTKPAAKATAKATAKPVTKTVTKSAAKPAFAPRTVADLHAHVEKLSARLTRADTRLRNTLKSLSAAQDALAEREQKTRSAERAGLIRRIDNLKAQLSGVAAQTRAATRTDLAEALSADNPDTMGKILARSEARIVASAAEQSRAVARLNQHLADMARAMDARLQIMETAQHDEAQARRTAIDTLSGRIDAVEQDTARAVTDIGERVVALATSLREDIEAKTPDGDVVERVNTLATSTQTQLEAVKTHFRGEAALATREATDAREQVDELSRRHEAAMQALTSRIEGLEYALSNPVQAAPVAAATPHSHLSVVPQAVEAPAAFAEPYAALNLQAPDMQATNTQAPAIGAPESYPTQPMALDSTMLATPEPTAEVAPAAQPQAGHFPQEWVPPQDDPSQAVAPVPQPQFAPQPEGFQASTPHFDAPQFSAPQFSALGEAGFAAMPDIDPSVVPRIGDADLPYANPAYAEPDTANRPVSEARAKTSILSKLKGRNARMVGMATAISAGMVYITLNATGEGGRVDKLVADGTLTPPAATTQALEIDPPEPNTVTFGNGMTADLSAPLPIVEAPTITDTSAMNVPLVASNSPQGQSLEAAARAGNPVAQYQLGIMQVERGDVASGIKSVRSAADQNLAAAQYRLAKFYETGQGVPTDLSMAVKLTERAARGGHRIAMHDLGFFHANGTATGTPDHMGAVKWFENAARMGVLDSQFNLAYLLDQGEGLGVPRNTSDAYFWYAVASRGGDEQAGDHMARLRSEIAPEQMTAVESRLAAFTMRPINEAANGIFRDLPWQPPASVSADGSRSTVKEIQSRLNSLGFDTGTPDGLAGPRTREAIVEFQRARRLPETGEPNAAVLAALQSEMDA